jgi:Ca2+-dependent lipid-binding protein
MEAVYIKLNKAYNLPDRDMLSENDVFIEIKYGDKKHISSVKNNTAEPEWLDEMFIFSKQQNINTLSVVIWDRDGLVNDKLAEEDFEIDKNNIVTKKGKYIELEVGSVFIMNENVRNNMLNGLVIG